MSIVEKAKNEYEAKRKLDNQQNAEKLCEYNRTHTKRTNKVNVCTGKANWNTCDYIDFNLQEQGQHGCECWKQDGQHDCLRCLEVNIK